MTSDTIKPGIRKKSSGKFIATKSIDGKRYYAEFKTLREAEIWRNRFHPMADNKFNKNLFPSIQDQRKFGNGRDEIITFGEVYNKYLEGPFQLLGIYAKHKYPQRMSRFLPPIFSVRMFDLTPEVITNLLNHSKNDVANDRRCNFNEELKILKSILNWYKSEKDFTFTIPVTKYHKKIGEIKPVEEKDKVLSLEQFLKFSENLKEPFKSMAIIQFFYALRVGEVAALTTDTVNISKKKIKISNVIIWINDRPTFKKETKTGVVTEFDLTDEIAARFLFLDNLRPKGCKFFFHHKGRPMGHRMIWKAYKEALKKADLGNFSGTHLLRFSMGTLTRKMDGLDASQAILRHKSSAMSEHYSELDFSETGSRVVLHAEELFLKTRATSATKEEVKVNDNKDLKVKTKPS